MDTSEKSDPDDRHLSVELGSGQASKARDSGYGRRRCGDAATLSPWRGRRPRRLVSSTDTSQRFTESRMPDPAASSYPDTSTADGSTTAYSS